MFDVMLYVICFFYWAIICSLTIHYLQFNDTCFGFKFKTCKIMEKYNRSNNHICCINVMYNWVWEFPGYDVEVY
ncbi:hypothetical protein DW071_23190 [Bacteroides ovatus]|nr:hypothetical protein DW071_23190 [Bacteroides ovatus]